MVATGRQDQLLILSASHANAVTITTRMDQNRRMRAEGNTTRPRLSMNQPRLSNDCVFRLCRFLLTYGNECVTMNRAIHLHTSPGPLWQPSTETRACNPCIPHTYRKPTCKSFIYCTYVNTRGCTPQKRTSGEETIDPRLCVTGFGHTPNPVYNGEPNPPLRLAAVSLTTRYRSYV